MTQSTEASSGEEADYRLPGSVVPRRYDLTMEPDLASATFTGTEAVTVDVLEAVDEVVLNAAELEIDEAWMAGPEDARLDATARLDEASERLTLALSGQAAPGSWTVHLRFRGVLNDKLRGFYRSTFKDGDGTEHVIATTQMEPVDARRAFPCWDEPDRKAVFAVTLVVAEDLLALSNGAQLSEEPTGDGRRAVRFVDTIPMSTYLVAFVVGPLVATAPVDVDGVPLRVVHAPGKDHLTNYALEVGAFCLRWFADYYGIAYPGGKLDLVAIPDFAAGAMENLGAITFREAVLLVDPEAVTQLELQRVADVVAHEIAHMWFGDLVTMKWWNGLWLNEAFATFMELAAIDAFKPEWHRWVAFTNERSAAFAVDSLGSTRPIEYPVRSPAEAEGMFDVLTYQKGASVLRMLEQYLGTEGFRAGIRRYLSARQFANAETTDLWDAIEEATGEPVRRIMDSWIFQGGYPIVAASRGDGGRLALEQQRFSFAGADEVPPATWSVPLLVSAGNGTDRVLLEQAAHTADLALDGDVAVLNAGGHGFYRVRYSPELLERLQAALPDLAPIERALLVDDTWAAVLAGETPASAFLDLASAYRDETDRTVWTTLAMALGQIDRILDGEARERFRGFVRDLASPAFDRLGWTPQPDEDELTRQRRGTLLTLLGVVGDDPGVQARAREVHDQHLADPNAVDPNVAAAVVGVVAASGTTADYEAFLERFRTVDSPQESLRYLYALAAFPDPELAQRTLDLTLGHDIRTQNAPFVLLLVLGNRDHGPLAWAHMKAQWDALNDALPHNAIPRMLGGITGLNTPELAADTAAFLADHPVPQGTRVVQQHLERQRVNVALRAREAARVAEALERLRPS